MIMILNMNSASFTGSPKLRRNLLLIASVGALISVLGAFLAPERMWPNILLAAYYLLSLGLAGVVFIALQYVSNAGWAVGIRRVPEAMISVLPAAAVLMLIVLIGIPILYPWSHADAASDHLLHAKQGWLNVPFFIARTIAYLAVWTALGFALARISRKQDVDGNLAHTQRNKKLSAAFLVIFALTFTVASMDWIMSLEPKWYSTIFGIYNFTGMLLNGLAAIAILVIILRRMGPLKKVVSESHLHDLGKLIFAFSTFWMYIWFSQYLLIWYANIPEEVIYFVRREAGGWKIFTGLNVVFNWIIPFVVLISQWSKRNEGLLLKVCAIIMIGRWVDLYWMILPPFLKSGPEVSIWEVGPMAGSVALFFFVSLRSFAKASPVPVKDPMLAESVQLHS
jgi:hypothetical protein